MILSLLANKPTWDLVDIEEGLSAISFDSLLSMEFKGDGKVTSEPVEKGSFATYNKVRSPQQLTVTLAQGGSPDIQESTLDYLNTICADTTTLSLVTPAMEYSPYTLESYNYRRTEKDGASLLVVELILIEVREVETQQKTTASQSIPAKSSKNASHASTTDTGKTQAKKPYTSVLASF